MTKYQYTGPAADYPTLGFSVSGTGAIIDGTMSTPTLAAPPDARWAVYGGGSAESGITRYGSSAGATPTVEPTDGFVLAYSDADNTFVPTDPAEFGGGASDSSVAAFVADDDSDTRAALAATFVSQVNDTSSALRMALDAIYAPPRAAVPTLAESGTGWAIRANSLDRYRASKFDTTKPTEVVIFGDSTSYGVSDGGDYSGGWIRALRDLVIDDAKHVDGGPGVLHFPDTADGSSDNIAPVFASTGATSGAGLAQYDFLLSTMCDLPATGNEVTYQGYGTSFRIHYTKQGGYGRFTYAVDGGSPVTIDALKTEGGVDSYVGCVQIDGLSDGLHKVRIINIGVSGGGTGDVRVCAEFFRDGLVFHKQAIGGITSTAYFPGVYGARIGGAALGLTQNTTLAPAARPPYRVADLGVFVLGINDPSSEATGTAAQVFADYCVAAECDGLIVVPHFDHAYTAAYRAAQVTALEGVAESNGFSIVYFDQALDDVGYAGPGTHLSTPGYQAEAQFIWDNVLSK